MATQLQLAEAQFTAFSHRERGYSIEDLAKSMGLTKSEWIKLKERGLHGLNELEIEYIDNLFNL